MIEIIGNFNTARVFATTLEDGAREQIKAVCDTEAFSSSKIRIMPDVHAGKGCTIGTTMTITDKIVPSMVGVDIGCGMYTVYLGNIDIDFEKVDEAAHFIPCGRNVWEGRQERFDLTQLRCYRSLRDTKRLERSLGTLGGGNHFVEVDADSHGHYYLIIHSGSRNSRIVSLECHRLLEPTEIIEVLRIPLATTFDIWCLKIRSYDCNHVVDIESTKFFSSSKRRCLGRMLALYRCRDMYRISVLCINDRLLAAYICRRRSLRVFRL